MTDRDDLRRLKDELSRLRAREAALIQFRDNLTKALPKVELRVKIYKNSLDNAGGYQDLDANAFRARMTVAVAKTAVDKATGGLESGSYVVDKLAEKGGELVQDKIQERAQRQNLISVKKEPFLFEPFLEIPHTINVEKLTGYLYQDFYEDLTFVRSDDILLTFGRFNQLTERFLSNDFEMISGLERSVYKICLREGWDSLKAGNYKLRFCYNWWRAFQITIKAFLDSRRLDQEIRRAHDAMKVISAKISDLSPKGSALRNYSTR